MKSLITISCFVLVCLSAAYTQTPTYAGLPDSSHVLVVFNSLDQTSIDVKDYYQLARGIPEINIVGLSLPSDTMITYQGETHLIKLDQQGEIIRDTNNQHSLEPTIHAWLYFNERIAKPIANYLKNNYVNGTPLKDIIRFIVLCKGVPFRIDARTEDADSRGTNVICANLLTHLGETMDDPDALLFYYNKTPGISNPYYNRDPNFTMDCHFLPNHYQTTWQGRNIKLSYLVTHLSAPRFEDIQGMIDRSLNAINETDYDWFIDADPTPCRGWNPIGSTATILNTLGITNYFFDNTETVYTTYSEDIMSYSSNGTWTTIDNPNPCAGMVFQPDYIQSQLNFNYADGAFFSSIESHNGLSIGTYPVVRTRGQGLIADFTLMGGTVAVGQAFHSPGSHVIKNDIFFPSYAGGYTFIEAAYLSLPNLDATNVVVGDPLTRIYSYQLITIASDTTITGGEFVGRIIVPQGKTLTIAAGSVLEFKRNSSLIVYGNVIIESQCLLNFNSYSYFRIQETGNLIIAPDAVINFKDNSMFETMNNFVVNAGYNFNFGNKTSFVSRGRLTINAGTTLNFNNSSKIKVYGSLFLNGSADNNVILNSNLKAELAFDSGDSLNITHTKINNFFLRIYSNLNGIRSILIKDSEFNIQFPNIFDENIIEIATSEVSGETDAKIVKTEINGFKALAIFANWLNSLVIDSCVLISSNNTNASAIDYKKIKNVVVSNSYFRVPKIINNVRWLDNSAFFIEESLSFKNCTFEFPNIINNNTVAIGIENRGENLRALKIENCNFIGYDVDIYLKNFGKNLIPVIRNNSFNDFKSFGINATNGAGIVIINNQFSSSSQGQSSQKTGIYLSHISYPHIISNNLSLQNQNLPGAGIFLGSSNGEIIGNNISGFRYGIELGSSSPNIGANVITANNENGIYSGAYSNPDLSYTVIDDGVYPVSGYNTIRENGLCNFYPGYSEIFLSRSNIQLKGGCNTIADDRDDPPLHCNYLYLIDGESVDETIYAGENYWGETNDHNPEGRFGSNITVEYEGYLNEPCSFTNGSDYLILTDQNGEVYDTIYSMLNNISQLSDIESKYAMANSYFYAKEFSQAKTKYENIVELYGNLRNSLKAYLRLYEIATFINTTPDEFNQLGQYYSQKAEIQTDSVMINVLRHLTSLCFVWSKNYEEALSRFESDIQNSQTNELVLYRTIDILTTSLLIEPDSAVGKRAARFVNIPGNLSYSALVSELLKTRGNSATNELIKLIPKQFNLYQNYPNPFNPNTTIKFDLPKSTIVNLSIYDILGRKVKTILNGRKEAGTYQINVDLSELSSGIYFYQLQTDEFVSTRKMLMLK